MKFHPAALVILCALLPASRARADSPPPSLLGAWDVEHVNVDVQDQMHWGIRPEDPQLLDRELAIQPESIHFTGDRNPCQQGPWKARTLTWAKLFGRSFSRDPGGGRSARPSPADFGLKVDKNATVTYYPICSTPEVLSTDTQNQRWVAQRGMDVLVMHYSNQVLLTLRRRPRDAKPRASFDCQKAATATETAICTSHDLAGWDRSAALAFKEAIARSPEKAGDIREEQRRWLKKRDACGGKSECLRETFWERVQELTMN
jgi:uncharacterized protein YecT (DUF1311 family)